jgi:hypothetical protein
MPYAERFGRGRLEARRACVSKEERRRLVLGVLGDFQLSTYDVAKTLDITFGYAFTLLCDMQDEGLVESARTGGRRLWWVA